MDRRELVGKRWTFRSADGGVIAQGLTLLEGGAIGGRFCAEYAVWDVIGGCLCFLNLDSYCTYRFSTVTRRDDGALDFAGRYTFDFDIMRGVTLTEECPTLDQIMAMFESLGDSCEFGFAQRYYGVEPLDLFRFAGISPANLLKALTDRLAAFDDPDSLTVTLDEIREYRGKVKAYGMQFHTFRHYGAISAEDVHALVRRKLLFSRRKFFEDLEEGNRLYVIRRLNGESLPQIIAIYEKLQSFGQRTLLWVTPADDTNPDGTIERLEDRLYRGYVGKVAYAQILGLRVHAASWAGLCRKVALDGAAPPLPPPARPAVTMRWTAEQETYIKASTDLAYTLSAADKIPVRPGDTVEAEAAGVSFNHVALKAARLNDSALPDRIWFLWTTAWRRC